MLRLIAAILTLLTLGASANAQSSLEILFGCDSKKPMCVIKESGGGIQLFFYDAADEVLQHGIQVIIDVPCASACVIFASVARANVCVTENAKMMIHKEARGVVYDPSGNIASAEDTIRYLLTEPPPGGRVEYEYFTPNYGEDINEWMLRENKVPADPNEFYTLTPEEVHQFWRSCEPAN